MTLGKLMESHQTAAHKKHTPRTQNWRDRTLFTRDNLQVLRGMNSRTVDLIYIDPPFGSGRDYALPREGLRREIAFRDTWAMTPAAQAWIDGPAQETPGLQEVLWASKALQGGSTAAYLEEPDRS